MSPTLLDGQTVLVRRADEARPGDVALLDAGGTPEIHRLLDRVRVGHRTWYIHAGDASSACGVAGEGDILGLVTVSRRRAAPVRARMLGMALRARALISILMR